MTVNKEYKITDCSECPELVSCRSQIVNGVGPMDADILIVGEAPGSNEDEEGEPFVGRSGDKLTETLTEAGFSRSDVRITNLVRCRPPDNRDPNKGEQTSCSTYLYEEINEVNPKVILPVGKVPNEFLLNRDVPVTKESGEVDSIEISGEEYDVLICPHPASIFYNRSLEEPFNQTVEKLNEWV